MKPLSVALVRQRYTPDGGAERFVSRALHALQAQGVAVTLIARQWRGEPGVKTLGCNPLYYGRWWRDRSFARGVCRLIQSHHFDLVQSHERIACCDIYRAGDGVHREWLQQLARIRGPFGRFGMMVNPYHRYVLAAERRLFTSPRLRAVVCNSRMVKEEIQRHFSVAAEKLHVIYSGVDTDSYHPRLREQRARTRRQYDIPETADLFLFVGSGFERKGVATLIAAMGSMPAGSHLLIVGRDKHQQRYERLARAHGLGTRVRFLGSRPDVKPFYGAADALVLPTLYDPFPNVALEAFATGLPVITSPKCGAAELINHGENGYVCDALDRAGLAACMRQFLSADRSALSQAARATTAGLGLEAMSQRLLKLYETVLSPR